MKKISIMTPCFNEVGNVWDVYQKVKEVFDKQLSNYSYEHLFIDNSSNDGTQQELRKIAAADKNIKVIFNTRNFGPHSSPYYALLQTSGDCVMPVVADLQDDPQLIGEFVKKWEEGYKIVLGVKATTEEGWPMRDLRKLFYHLMSRLSTIQTVPNFTGFGLYDKKIIDHMREFDDPMPFFRGLICEIGYEYALIHYDQKNRRKGKSKNRIKELVDYALLGFTSYSRLIPRVAWIVGALTFFMSMFAFIVGIISRLAGMEGFMGHLGILALFAFSGIQLLFLGILAEYMFNLMPYLRRRPLVIEKERINF